MSEEPQETAGSKRMSAVIQAPPGYTHVDTVIVYAHNSLIETPPELDGKPFRIPDMRASLKKLAERFPGAVVFGEDESRTRGGADHIAWSLFFDTPETASARQPRRTNGRRPTEKDVPKLLKEVGAAVLDESVIADAERLKVTVKQAARAKVATAHGISVEELQQLITDFLNG